MKIKSAEAWELLARGRTAEIFKVSDTEAVKLFYPGYSLVAATEEYERSAFIHGVYDRTVRMQPPGQHQGRISISMDFIRGSGLHDDLGIGNAGETGLSLGLMHRNLHVRPSEGLPNAHAVFASSVREFQGLTGRIQNNMLRFLNSTRNDRLCHGDFHPGHIIQGRDGLILVDWKMAFAGDPSADIAAALLGLQRTCSIVLQRKLRQQYLKGYFGRDAIPEKDIRRWKILTAIRCMNHVSLSEKVRLKAMIGFYLPLFR